MHDDDNTPPHAKPKPKPWLDQQLEQLALDCEAGRITPEDMAQQMVDACDRWGAPYLNAEKRAQVKTWLEDLAAVDLAVERASEDTK